MSDKTEISWSDATWNPIIGCTKVSPGCDHCYPIPLSRIREKNPNPKVASAFAGVVQQTENGVDWTGRVNLLPERLDQPLHWRKPRRVFVNSLSDLFHKAVPDRFIAEVFNRMGAAHQHTFQILTKRHGRMRSLLSRWSEHATKGCYCPSDEGGCSAPVDVEHGVWPLPNVWLGVSVEDQKRADLRIPALLDTPAAVRWISAEPLLGPVDLYGPIVNGHRPKLTYWLTGRPGWGNEHTTETGLTMTSPVTGPRLDWVVTGGESGPGARPMHPKWVKDLRDQCQQAGVAYHFKQWGEWRPQPRYSTDDRHHLVMVNGMDRGTPWPGWGLDQPDAEVMERVGKKRAGRELDGRTWDQFPDTKPQEVSVR